MAIHIGLIYAFESSDTYQILIIMDALEGEKKSSLQTTNFFRNPSFPLPRKCKGSLKKTVEIPYISGNAPIN